MALNLKAPETDMDLRPRITVFGVGGAGGNAVNNMIEKSLEGVEFVVANTDAQALGQTRASRGLQLGANVTQGLGAGAKPAVGAQAAEESLEDIVDHLAGSHMCFITAGMGGGTGTGAAPVIARAAREMGILTVGVVTRPFQFEGTNRMRLADQGIAQLQQVVDTLIIIPNQNLFRIANERTTFAEAFMMADDVLYQGVKGVTDLMVRPGLINLDFADVRAVMDEMGKAMMGTGEAEGDTRAIDAAEKAISNPLLDEVSLKGARGVLINITGGYDLTLFELDEAANRIRAEVDPDANIIVGSTLDPDMSNVMRVSVVATGIDSEAAEQPQPAQGDGARPALRAVETAKPAEAAPEAMPAEPAARVQQPAARQPTFADKFRRPAHETPAPPMRPAAAEPPQPAAQAEPFAPEIDFDLDDVPPAPVETPAQPRENPILAAERGGDPAPAHRAPAPSRAPAAEAADGRPAGRFAFNNLIHRMTGANGEGQPGQPAAAPRREPASHRALADDEDARMEIPAFLRRQAN